MGRTRRKQRDIDNDKYGEWPGMKHAIDCSKLFAPEYQIGEDAGSSELLGVELTASRDPRLSPALPAASIYTSNLEHAAECVNQTKSKEHADNGTAKEIWASQDKDNISRGEEPSAVDSVRKRRCSTNSLHKDSSSAKGKSRSVENKAEAGKVRSAVQNRDIPVRRASTKQKVNSWIAASQQYFQNDGDAGGLKCQASLIPSQQDQLKDEAPPPPPPPPQLQPRQSEMPAEKSVQAAVFVTDALKSQRLFPIDQAYAAGHVDNNQADKSSPHKDGKQQKPFVEEKESVENSREEICRNVKEVNSATENKTTSEHKNAPRSDGVMSSKEKSKKRKYKHHSLERSVNEKRLDRHRPAKGFDMQRLDSLNEDVAYLDEWTSDDQLLREQFAEEETPRIAGSTEQKSSASERKHVKCRRRRHLKEAPPIDETDFLSLDDILKANDVADKEMKAIPIEDDVLKERHPCLQEETYKSRSIERLRPLSSYINPCATSSAAGLIGEALECQLRETHHSLEAMCTSPLRPGPLPPHLPQLSIGTQLESTFVDSMMVKRTHMQVMKEWLKQRPLDGLLIGRLTVNADPLVFCSSKCTDRTANACADEFHAALYNLMRPGADDSDIGAACDVYPTPRNSTEDTVGQVFRQVHHYMQFLADKPLPQETSAPSPQINVVTEHTEPPNFTLTPITDVPKEQKNTEPVIMKKVKKKKKQKHKHRRKTVEIPLEPEQIDIQPRIQDPRRLQETQLPVPRSPMPNSTTDMVDANVNSVLDGFYETLDNLLLFNNVECKSVRQSVSAIVGKRLAQVNTLTKSKFVDERQRSLTDVKNTKFNELDHKQDTSTAREELEVNEDDGLYSPTRPTENDEATANSPFQTAFVPVSGEIADSEKLTNNTSSKKKSSKSKRKKRDRADKENVEKSERRKKRRHESHAEEDTTPKPSEKVAENDDRLVISEIQLKDKSENVRTEQSPGKESKKKHIEAHVESRTYRLPERETIHTSSRYHRRSHRESRSRRHNEHERRSSKSTKHDKRPCIRSVAVNPSYKDSFQSQSVDILGRTPVSNFDGIDLTYAPIDHLDNPYLLTWFMVQYLLLYRQSNMNDSNTDLSTFCSAILEPENSFLWSILLTTEEVPVQIAETGDGPFSEINPAETDLLDILQDPAETESSKGIKKNAVKGGNRLMQAFRQAVEAKKRAKMVGDEKKHHGRSMSNTLPGKSQVTKLSAELAAKKPAPKTAKVLFKPPGAFIAIQQPLAENIATNCPVKPFQMCGAGDVKFLGVSLPENKPVDTIVQNAADSLWSWMEQLLLAHYPEETVNDETSKPLEYFTEITHLKGLSGTVVNLYKATKLTGTQHANISSEQLTQKKQQQESTVLNATPNTYLGETTGTDVNSSDILNTPSREKSKVKCDSGTIALPFSYMEENDETSYMDMDEAGDSAWQQTMVKRQDPLPMEEDEISKAALVRLKRLSQITPTSNTASADTDRPVASSAETVATFVSTPVTNEMAPLANFSIAVSGSNASDVSHSLLTLDVSTITCTTSIPSPTVNVTMVTSSLVGEAIDVSEQNLHSSLQTTDKLSSMRNLEESNVTLDHVVHEVMNDILKDIDHQQQIAVCDEQPVNTVPELSTVEQSSPSPAVAAMDVNVRMQATGETKKTPGRTSRLLQAFHQAVAAKKTPETTTAPKRRAPFLNISSTFPELKRKITADEKKSTLKISAISVASHEEFATSSLEAKNVSPQVGSDVSTDVQQDDTSVPMDVCDDDDDDDDDVALISTEVSMVGAAPESRPPLPSEEKPPLPADTPPLPTDPEVKPPLPTIPDVKPPLPSTVYTIASADEPAIPGLDSAFPTKSGSTDLGTIPLPPGTIEPAMPADTLAQKKVSTTKIPDMPCPPLPPLFMMSQITTCSVQSTYQTPAAMSYQATDSQANYAGWYDSGQQQQQQQWWSADDGNTNTEAWAAYWRQQHQHQQHQQHHDNGWQGWQEPWSDYWQSTQPGASDWSQGWPPADSSAPYTDTGTWRPSHKGPVKKALLPTPTEPPLQPTPHANSSPPMQATSLRPNPPGTERYVPHTNVALPQQATPLLPEPPGTERVVPHANFASPKQTTSLRPEPPGTERVVLGVPRERTAITPTVAERKPAESIKQSFANIRMYVLNRDKVLCKSIEHFLVFMGARTFDPFQLRAVVNGGTVELLVLVHLNDVHLLYTVPNLLQLKQEARVKFATYTDVLDVKHRRYLPILVTGGMLIADDDILTNVQPETLRHMCEFLEMQTIRGVTWSLKLHSYTIGHLQIAKNRHPEGSANRQRLIEVCSILTKFTERNAIHVLPAHSACCGWPKTARLYLACCMELQSTLCNTYRHSLFLTDIPPGHRDVAFFPDNGIGVISIVNFVKNIVEKHVPEVKHPITATDFGAQSSAQFSDVAPSTAVDRLKLVI